MARARIGKLFHLTPLVDDLGDAEYFFNSVFSPLCMMRNYSAALAPARGDLRHRRNVDRADAVSGTGAGPGKDQLVPLRREVRPTRAQHGVLRRRPRRPRAAPGGCRSARHRRRTRGTRCSATRRTPRACSSSTRHHGLWTDRDPRFRPEWDAFADAFWGQHHPLGVQRVSHLTVVVDDLPGAEKFYVEVLDAVPLPDQDATVPGGVAALRGGR